MENSTQPSSGQTKKCPKCHEDIQQAAKKCRHCNSDLRNFFMRHKIITVIGGLFVLGLILSMAGIDDDKLEQASSNAIAETEIINVSAVELSKEYDANKVAADAKYENKILQITGIVDSINKDILDDPYVTLQGRPNSLFGVQCMFPRSDEAELAKLSKGQTIVLQGRASNEFIGNVIVRGCKIIK